MLGTASPPELGIIVFGITTIRKTMGSAQAAAEMSKMRYLSAVVMPYLEKYYREHGSYPPALMDLRIPEKELMGDGSKPEDLTRFQYDSDSNVFRLIWSNPIYGFKLEGVRTNFSWSAEKAKYR